MQRIKQLQQYVADWYEDYTAASMAHEQLDMQLDHHDEQGAPYPDIKDIQVVLDLWVLESRSNLLIYKVILE